MVQFYETYYGIYDHLNKPSPLASVLFHPAEDYLTNSLYDSYIRLHTMKGIYAKTGHTLESMLDMPRYKITHLLKIVDEIDLKKNTEEENALKRVSAVDSSVTKGKP